MTPEQQLLLFRENGGTGNLAVCGSLAEAKALSAAIKGNLGNG